MLFSLDIGFALEDVGDFYVESGRVGNVLTFVLQHFGFPGFNRDLIGIGNLKVHDFTFENFEAILPVQNSRDSRT